MSKENQNLFERISELKKRVTTPKLLAEELEKRNCFVDVPDNAQEMFASQIENMPDDKKGRYIISHSVYTDDDCLISLILFLNGKKIVKIAKVKVG